MRPILYCSRKCSNIITGRLLSAGVIVRKNPGRKPRPPHECGVCGTLFQPRAASVLRKGKRVSYVRRYCSKQCAGLGPGTSKLFDDAARTITVRYRKFGALACLLRTGRFACEKCGYDTNMRALVIHHMDRDRTNDRLSNLQCLCANCHAIEHAGDGVNFGALIRVVTNMHRLLTRDPDNLSPKWRMLLDSLNETEAA